VRAEAETAMIAKTMAKIRERDEAVKARTDAEERARAEGRAKAPKKVKLVEGKSKTKLIEDAKSAAEAMNKSAERIVTNQKSASDAMRKLELKNNKLMEKRKLYETTHADSNQIIGQLMPKLDEAKDAVLDAMTKTKEEHDRALKERMRIQKLIKDGEEIADDSRQKMDLIDQEIRQNIVRYSVLVQDMEQLKQTHKLNELNYQKAAEYLSESDAEFDEFDEFSKFSLIRRDVSGRTITKPSAKKSGLDEFIGFRR